MSSNLTCEQKRRVPIPIFLIDQTKKKIVLTWIGFGEKSPQVGLRSPTTRVTFR